jgi:anti-sigma regulatory factor (Ser/Thr protein kinase)
VTSARRFRCRRESVSDARRFARDVIGKQPNETLDAIELMVSELATNCIQHAQSDFEIAIGVSRREIRIEARDTGEGRPAPRSPGPTEPTGRGLRIVEAMSDSWGIIPGTRGKTVWFTLTLQPSASNEQTGSAARGERSAASSRTSEAATSSRGATGLRRGRAPVGRAVPARRGSDSRTRA